MKSLTISKTILLTILIILTIIPITNAVEYYKPDFKDVILEKSDKLYNEDLHILSYVKSGDICHENFDYIGLYSWGLNGFCIGLLVHLDLTWWQEETRLTVRNIFGLTTYDYDVRVTLRGFIGFILPSVPSVPGTLKGCAIITKVIPLN